jgi:uncharacterized membrane protein
MGVLINSNDALLLKNGTGLDLKEARDCAEWKDWVREGGGRLLVKGMKYYREQVGRR